jgi:hypothetical protein
VLLSGLHTRSVTGLVHERLLHLERISLTHSLKPRQGALHDEYFPFTGRKLFYPDGLIGYTASVLERFLDDDELAKYHLSEAAYIGFVAIEHKKFNTDVSDMCVHSISLFASRPDLLMVVFVERIGLVLVLVAPRRLLLFVRCYKLCVVL